MNNGNKIVFFGTSRFAVIVFEQLLQHGFVPSLLITQPDCPQGHRLVLAPPPAKIWATEHNIPILQPKELDDTFAKMLKNNGYQLAIVASYGTIIPKNILDLFLYGILNVHPSLLPKYRGASPLQSTILNDDKNTGVTVIMLDEKMDHGPIVAVEHVLVPEWPPSVLVLEDILAKAGGKLLASTIKPWLRGEIHARAQDDSKATYTKKKSRSDGELDLTGDPYKNYLKICAFEPWPGTFFFIQHKTKKMRIKITKALFKNEELFIERVVPEGKHEMAYKDFCRNQDERA